MGELVQFVGPTSVEFEGQALAVVTIFSTMAVKLAAVSASFAKMAEELPPEVAAKAVANVAVIDTVVQLMTAIQDSISCIEQNATEITATIQDGEEATFGTKSYDIRLAVMGVLRRRHSAILVRELGVNKLAADDRRIEGARSLTLVPISYDRIDC